MSENDELTCPNYVCSGGLEVGIIGIVREHHKVLPTTLRKEIAEIYVKLNKRPRYFAYYLRH